MNLTELLPVIEKHYKEATPPAQPPPPGAPQGDDESIIVLNSEIFFKDDEPVHIHPHPWWLAPPVTFKDSPFYHSHDFFEIVYAFRGRFRHRISPDGKAVDQEEGSLMMFNLSTGHSVEADSKDCRAFNIMISRSTIEQIFILYDDSVFFRFFIDTLYREHQRHRYLLFPGDQELSELSEKIIASYYQPKPFLNQELKAMVLHLFSMLARQYLAQYNPTKTSSEITPAGVLSYTHKHYTTVTMEDLEKEFYYTRRQLSRIFMQEVGMSFTDYITNLKITTAQNYAKNTLLSASKVSDIMGYRDPMYFCRVFKKKTGFSFKEYRARNSTNTSTDTTKDSPAD